MLALPDIEHITTETAVEDLKIVVFSLASFIEIMGFQVAYANGGFGYQDNQQESRLVVLPDIKHITTETAVEDLKQIIRAFAHFAENMDFEVEYADDDLDDLDDETERFTLQ